jgi:predicted RNase H-like nuclease
MIGHVSVEDWGRDLRELIARGRGAHGNAEVLGVLQREVASLTLGTDAPPALLNASRPVLGVDACLTGWVGVLLGPDARPTVHVAGSVEALVAQVREGADVAVVAIDMPIGLPDDDRVRLADQLAREALPGKESAVRGAATRAAYGSGEDFDVLVPKVLQVDAWVRGDPGTRVVEVEPELCFARLAGSPVLAAKRTEEGLAQRRDALGRAGLAVPPWYSGSGFAEHDLLDACAALWTAVRYLNGESESLPEQPEVFSDGLAAAIHV